MFVCGQRNLVLHYGILELAHNCSDNSHYLYVVVVMLVSGAGSPREY